MTLLIVGGVAYAITKAVERPINPPDVVLPPASTSLGVGAKVPVDFTLPALGASGTISLKAELDGRPGVVNFFASWCTICRQELPGFAAAANGYGSSVAFVGVDTDDASPDAALSLARTSGVTYPIMNDTARGAVRSAYGLSGYPATFIVDRTGHLRWEIIGAVTKAQLEAKLAPLLASAAG